MMASRIFHLIIFSGVFYATSLLAAEDDEILFKSGINIGARTIKFDQNFVQGPLTTPGTPTTPAFRTSDYTVDFKSLNVSFAAAWRDYYATLEYETSLDTQDGTYHATYQEIIPGVSTPLSQGQASFAFDRDDYAVTLGWNAYKNLSVFVGYKNGLTDTTRPGKTIDRLNRVSDTDITTTFKEDGPYLGCSYNWLFNDAVLTLSGAYAYMAGDFNAGGNELIANVTTAPNNFAAAEQALRYNGHTDGLSFNLSWNVQPSNHIGYYYGIKYQQYDFNALTDVTWIFYDRRFGLPATVYQFRGTGQVNNSETITSFYAGLNYLF